MRILCWFNQCEWRYFGNVAIPNDDPISSGAAYDLTGLYQCARCKSLSVGAPTDPAKRRASPQTAEEPPQ